MIYQTYDEQLNRLAKLIVERVNYIAKRHKTPHNVVWNDLDVILSSVEGYREAKTQ